MHGKGQGDLPFVCVLFNAHSGRRRSMGDYKSYSMELGGRTLTVDIGRVGKQANGCCFMHYGDTVVLSTATASKAPRDGIDFFPLSVDFDEKMYAVGKIPGGFNKREGKASTHAVLTSRVIDRPMRPLFPKDFRNDVTLNNMVMSVDPECDPEVPAMLGSALATAISDIPWDGPCAMTQLGLIDGEFVINPGYEQKQKSDLQLTVASTRDKVIMIEAGANELPEDKMIEAIYKCDEVNREIISFFDKIIAECGKPKFDYQHIVINPELNEALYAFCPAEKMEEIVFTDDRASRDAGIAEVRAAFAEQYGENEDWMAQLDEALYQYQKKTVRKMILKDHKRPDGREITQIRPLAAEVDLIPRAHGSAMFTRGQTQICDCVTLAPLSEAQRVEGLDPYITRNRYMHHYNFPSYSVGETKPSRGPGRREIGHGALAERALIPVLPSEEEFPYAIRVVSEVLSSNGSSSMASTCGSTLALMDAGVPIKKPVSGIAMGLIEGFNEDGSSKFAILSDIQGMEDFLGDMDFKVTGTPDGVTALQMDIKVHGLNREILKQALDQAKVGRAHILESMLEEIAEPRAELSPYAPRFISMRIDPDKIRLVIGPGGKTVNRIVEETGAKIDISDDDVGFIAIYAVDQESAEAAKREIELITAEVEVGKTYEGVVRRVMAFGAFIEILPGKEGLLHISRMANHRVARVEDVMNIGDKVTVVVTEIDNQNRINLSRKELVRD